MKFLWSKTIILRFCSWEKIALIHFEFSVYYDQKMKILRYLNYSLYFLFSSIFQLKNRSFRQTIYVASIIKIQFRTYLSSFKSNNFHMNSVIFVEHFHDFSRFIQSLKFSVKNIEENKDQIPSAVD